MYILSFKDGHDPAAALLKDGVIVAAAEEERFNRIKHAPSYFPVESIRYCLKEAGIGEVDIDQLVYARLTPWQTIFKVLGYYLFHPPTTKVECRYALSHIKVQLKGSLDQALGRAGFQRLWKHFPNITRNIQSVDHHLAHAASAYYFSGFDEALVITIDGKGEATSVLVAEGNGLQLRPLERRGIFESIGLFYSALTEYLGFTPNDGEYKVMGLAPYGRPTEDFLNILAPDPEKGYRIDSDFVLYPHALRSFEERFGPRREREAEIGERHFAVGASAQKALEDSAVELVRVMLKKYPHKKLCLAGGVALNVKMNKIIWESGFIEDIFVQPAAGDDGLVLGAAALMYVQLTGNKPGPLTHLYLGPGFSEAEAKAALKEAGLVYTRSADVVAEAAALIEAGHVIGWCQGRMEFGPRALGARSVLADPRLANMQETVNTKIKFRERFRPFCPSVLEEGAPELFERYRKAPFMITSFSVKPGVAEKIPAVVHVDGTVRPQAVSKEANRRYYDLIAEFKRRTGVPAILNTSMNVRGEPIVCTPTDAVDFFLKTNVDAVVIGDYIALKNDQDPELLKTLSYETLNTLY